MDGAKKFTDAADEFLSEVAAILSDSEVVVVDGEGKRLLHIEAVKELIDMVHRGLQCAKLMKEEPKNKKNGKETEPANMADKWAEDRN